MAGKQVQDNTYQEDTAAAAAAGRQQRKKDELLVGMTARFMVALLLLCICNPY
jgi:hypothetical protein